MKISLNWIFDHIAGDKNKIAITDFVDRFIKTTAEIEGWKHVTLPVEKLTLVQIVEMTDKAVHVYSSELNKQYLLPLRTDVTIGFWYFVEHDHSGAQWAKISSLGGTKDTLLPAVEMAEQSRSGAWKKNIEFHDYIIDIDNKSINHRPDLWGHRGIAREIAAIFDMNLKPLEQFVVDVQSAHIQEQPLQGKTGDFSISIEVPELCKRFSALHITTISSRPSDVHMMIRLSRLDSKPIDFLVDTTNYVMLDLGQPMHAFDAQKLSGQTACVRRAHNQEKLTLLDGETITLTPEDVVVADGKNSVSLAGIMGGSKTGITAKTTSVILEAAHFDATTIRRTAARYKKRTESSMRFEKSLDPEFSSNAIKRFLYMLDQARITYKSANQMVQLGKSISSTTIIVPHMLIESRLGIVINPEKIKSILEKLSFVVEQMHENVDMVYHITPPSFRITKDIKIAEDIIEEIGRYVGYDSIQCVMPAIGKFPANLHKTYTIRSLKKVLTNGLSMRELYCYSFFDESFLKILAWQPIQYIEVKDPISENYTRLITTLQPHLFKAIGDNSIHNESLRFYEWARVWHLDGDIHEKKSLSGVIFERQKNFDFYDGKSCVEQIFAELSMNVLWKKADCSVYPWLRQHQTALLMHQEQCIGIAGMVEETVVDALSSAGGSLFVFELDGDYLINHKHPLTRFVPLPKYPSVRRDVSILVSLAMTVDTITGLIKQSDNHIESVTLLDFFTKPEWHDQKALTFHVEIRDNNKTLEHDEVEYIWGKVVAALQSCGATIR